MKEQITTPISDFVRAYAYGKNQFSRFHMPGHKGQGSDGEKMDITEIHGADSLYEASGIIAESEANATKLFGTYRTYYSTEGSSQCIRAMLLLALRAAPKSAARPVLLAARNAHKALIYAAALLDFDIEWLWPESDGGELCSCEVSGGGLAAALAGLKARGTAPFGVYVTSPDYLGGVQDIAALAAVCQKNGVPLLVDNAHGAYLRFLPGASAHPIDLGAAMCCDSAHKTLPVLTGGAYLHIGSNAPQSAKDPAAAKSALALFGSTSPSYLILTSLDMCNPWLGGDFAAELAGCLKRVADITAAVNAAAARAGCPLPLIVAGPGREPMKLTLDAAALGQSGAGLGQFLRSKFIECEYAGPRYVVLMPSPENSWRDFALLETALNEAIALYGGSAQGSAPAKACSFSALRAQTRRHCTIREAVLSQSECVAVKNALGRVCAAPAVSCPPAIPIAVSGEEITPAAIELFERFGISEAEVIKDT